MAQYACNGTNAPPHRSCVTIAATHCRPRAHAPASCGITKHRSQLHHARQCRAQAEAAADVAQSPAEQSQPEFTIRFQTAEGERVLEGVESGDILRDVMLDTEPKVDLYTTWGKVVSCGGGGQCGTCIVEVLEGSEYLGERNDTEQKKLKKKPDNYRLACQTNVGDGENSGSVAIRTKPP